LVTVVLGFALKVSDSYSRVWLFTWFFSSIILVCAERGLISLLLQRWSRTGLIGQNVVIVGCSEQGTKLLNLIRKGSEPWIHVLGFFEENGKRTPATLMGVPVLGDVDDLVAYSRENDVDDIYIALPWNAEERVQAIMNKLEVLPVNIFLSPDLVWFRFLGHDYRQNGGIAHMKLSEIPISGWKRFAKELEDRILGTILLLFSLPVMLVVGLAVKVTSAGPVFFRQTRHGFNNQLVEVWKFRTMYVDPDPDPSVPQAKLDDPRVTRVGRFLRRYSLDELPQLFNVLRGEMSLVGPRPHAVAHNEQYDKTIDQYLGRHRVKPGITGWAQVNGLRGETDTLDKMKDRLEHDLYYIRNWSLLFDLWIILKTPIVLIKSKNAY